jgi:hypothetical protein
LDKYGREHTPKIDSPEEGNKSIVGHFIDPVKLSVFELSKQYVEPYDWASPPAGLQSVERALAYNFAHQLNHDARA